MKITSTMTDTTNRAYQALRDWANWSAGYHAGKGSFDGPDTMAVDQLSRFNPADDPASFLVRWAFAHMPVYRDLPTDRTRWRKLRQIAARHQYSREETGCWYSLSGTEYLRACFSA